MVILIHYTNTPFYLAFDCGFIPIGIPFFPCKSFPWILVTIIRVYVGHKTSFLSHGYHCCNALLLPFAQPCYSAGQHTSIRSKKLTKDKDILWKNK